MTTNSAKTEELEIELDDETAKIAHALAEARGISVEQLITQVLSEAIEDGYFSDVVE